MWFALCAGMTLSSRSPRTTRCAAALLVPASAPFTLTGCAGPPFLQQQEPTFQAPSISASDVGLPGASPVQGSSSGSSAGVTTSVYDLQIGQCFNEESSGDTIGDAEVVDCDQPHDYELYALIQLLGDEYDALDVSIESDTTCQEDVFTEYVGRPYLSSIYLVDTIVPSEESWTQDNDRTTLCLVEKTGERGSAQGTNQ